MFCFINKQRKGNKENFKYTDSSLTKRVKRRENFSLSWKKDWSISIIEGEGFLSATESVVFCFQNSINRYGNTFQRGNLAFVGIL